MFLLTLFPNFSEESDYVGNKKYANGIVFYNMEHFKRRYRF